MVEPLAPYLGPIIGGLVLMLSGIIGWLFQNIMSRIRALEHDSACHADVNEIKQLLRDLSNRAETREQRIYERIDSVTANVATFYSQYKRDHEPSK